MRIPLIEDLITGPVPGGSTFLVEYDAASQWYLALVTVAAGWLKDGGRVLYGVTAHPPDNIRLQLKRLGVNAEELEESGKLRIADWYMATLGQKSKEKLAIESLKVADLSIWWSKFNIGAPVPSLLRLLDDFSCLDRFNDEKSWVEFVLTRAVPTTFTRKETGIRGIIRDLHSNWVYKRLEAAHDGIIDFKLEEGGEEPRNLIRMRRMRNVTFDGRWHALKIGPNFEVALDKAKLNQSQ